jgi:hypothetical protein
LPLLPVCPLEIVAGHKIDIAILLKEVVARIDQDEGGGSFGRRCHGKS